jgi:aspartate aminotransferase
MFEQVATAAPDPILGLTEAFQKDERKNKINLSVGVFQDEAGATPILKSVKEAERRLLELENSKNYRPISGDPEYGRRVRELLFGASSELIGSGRSVTAHTPGGTGALRVIGDYLATLHRGASLWLSQPTWANHSQVFEAAGLSLKSYPYFDKRANDLAFEAMLTALEEVPEGDAVLLHACCHNPTGVDPTPDQWQRIAEVLRGRGLLPVVDFAYQGFGIGVDEDAEGLRILLRHLDELAICSSFSKNFGLYNERTGALTVVAKTKAHADAVFSQVKIRIRANYSNPPAHGAAIVSTVLGDEQLKAKWLTEVAEMRARIAAMRQLFVETLHQKGAVGDFSFITRQHGMFSFSGLSPEQVERLRRDHAIYIVSSGRINVAGMSAATMPALCEAIVSVL